MSKNKHAQALVKKHWDKVTPEERTILAKKMGKASWANKTEEERSIEMSRRRNLGILRGKLKKYGKDK